MSVVRDISQGFIGLELLILSGLSIAIMGTQKIMFVHILYSKMPLSIWHYKHWWDLLRNYDKKRGKVSNDWAESESYLASTSNLCLFFLISTLCHRE